MSDEVVWREGQWRDEPWQDGVRWVPPGYYNPNLLLEEWPEGSFTLTRFQMTRLIPTLEDLGLIKPRLDERLRTEDLKITHRLLDLLDKQATT